jgi:hypothetical protein
MRSAAIYVLKDRVLLHPWQKTTEGVGIGSEPYATVSPQATAYRLGEVVLIALAASGKSVPHPKSWNNVARPRLEAAGVNSETAFHNGTLSVTVNWRDDVLSFEPSRNGGASGAEKGFHPLPEASVSVAAGAGPETIGATLRSAIKRCR